MSEKKLRRQAVKFTKVDGSGVWIFPLLLCIFSFYWEAVGGRGILVAGNSSGHSCILTALPNKLLSADDTKSERKIRVPVGGRQISDWDPLDAHALSRGD